MNRKLCTRPELRDLLPDHYSGHLNVEMSELVKAHLKECETCADAVQFMEKIGGPRAGIETDQASKHPSAHDIGRYYDGAELLPPDEVERMRQHIDTCEQCRYDFEFLSRTESDLRRPLLKPDTAPPFWVRMFGLGAGMVKSPAFAYFVLALLIYPSARWMLSESSDRTDWGGKIYELGGTTRGLGTEIEVYRERGSHIIRLSLPELPDPTRSCWNVELRGRSTQSAHTVQSMVLNSTDQLLVYLDVHAVPDGRYDLRIKNFACENQDQFDESAYLINLRSH